ncbi:hypothetical protein OC846_001488 [Tilletia horrida]|uniref:Mid2 domain-containing protein n=1 Tax=Tilletia horrida TaxID=155126 RepID=A0AAN6GST7_9BASI|nr:hypothetical protein OC845_001449 [Tilletia horrida]KAK0555936.1 hypothetical protein OC846_001488 [Tilletia horrida]KAK0568824.1 hypothetical protein OC861_001517 [Tilletia horrida]
MSSTVSASWPAPSFSEHGASSTIRSVEVGAGTPTPSSAGSSATPFAIHGFNSLLSLQEGNKRTKMSPGTKPHSLTNSHTAGIILGCVIGGIVLIFIVFFLGYRFWVYRHRRAPSEGFRSLVPTPAAGADADAERGVGLYDDPYDHKGYGEDEASIEARQQFATLQPPHPQSDRPHPVDGTHASLLSSHWSHDSHSYASSFITDITEEGERNSGWNGNECYGPPT